MPSHQRHESRSLFKHHNQQTSIIILRRNTSFCFGPCKDNIGLNVNNDNDFGYLDQNKKQKKNNRKPLFF